MVCCRSRWGTDPQLTRRGIGEKLDILASLLDLAEGPDAALEQRMAVLG
jgi:hypothetical protein